MLADGEDEGVVDSETLALWLCDVQVISLCMRRWMAGQELVWRVLSCVNDGKGECKGMWDILDRVHQASLSGVDLQDSLTFVTW
jgi:hypothetical protein